MSKYNGYYKEEPLQRKRIGSPVSLAEVKENLHFDEPNEAHPSDGAIQLNIESAIDAAENYCNRTFAKTEIKHKAYNYSGYVLTIKAAPYMGIKHIKTSTDNGANFTTLTEGTHYDILKTGIGIQVHFINSITVDEIEIIYYAGYDDSQIPASVKAWIIRDASDLNDTDRSNYTYSVERSNLRERALSPYIITYW